MVSDAGKVLSIATSGVPNLVKMVNKILLSGRTIGESASVQSWHLLCMLLRPEPSIAQIYQLIFLLDTMSWEAGPCLSYRLMAVKYSMACVGARKEPSSSMYERSFAMSMNVWKAFW